MTEIVLVSMYSKYVHIPLRELWDNMGIVHLQKKGNTDTKALPRWPAETMSLLWLHIELNQHSWQLHFCHGASASLYPARYQQQIFLNTLNLGDSHSDLKEEGITSIISVVGIFKLVQSEWPKMKILTFPGHQLQLRSRLSMASQATSALAWGTWSSRVWRYHSPHPAVPGPCCQVLNQ